MFMCKDCLHDCLHKVMFRVVNMARHLTFLDHPLCLERPLLSARGGYVNKHVGACHVIDRATEQASSHGVKGEHQE